MFTNQKTVPGKVTKKSENLDSAVTILTNGCHFKGKLYCRGSTRIGGKVEGEISSEGLLIIEEEAVICANIQADEVIIQGQVRGKLESRDRVELCQSSSFHGDVFTPLIVIREGARFNGHSTMVGDDKEDQVGGVKTEQEFEAPPVAVVGDIPENGETPEVSVI